MADVTQTLSLITLQQAYGNNIVRQANRRAVLLKLLGFKKGQGKNVAGVMEGNGAVAESFAEGADATDFGSDSQAAVINPWGLYRANFHVSGLAAAASATSATPQGNIELWGRNIVNAGTKLADLLGTDLYTGNAANKIVGLDEAIGSVSNTYATIDRAATAIWRPYVVDPGVATALSFTQIRTDLATIYTNSGTRPDIAMVHPNVLTQIGALFDPQKQYMYRTDTIMTMGERGKVDFEGGVGAIHFDGCWFVEDRLATSGKIYYLNTEYCWIEYLPLDLADIPGLDDEVLEMYVDDGYGVTPLGARVEMLAKTGDSDKAQMKTYVQLWVGRPNACGVRKNVAV